MGSTSIAIATTTNPVTLPAGFHDLYQRYSDVVYKTALRVTGRAEDAEDVLQTVFLRILRNEVHLTPDWAPERYLRRSATNAAIDVLRQRTSQAETTIENWQNLAGPESTVLLKQRVRRALAKLEPEMAELFVLFHLEGFSYDELAEQFNVEKGTVASRLHRIRHTLRQEIEK
jgi:RNA polymerase sigma-70 factor (ECF subfamily)